MTIIRVGLDPSKRVLQAHRVEAAEQPVVRCTLRRGEAEMYVAALPPTRAEPVA